jgi:hypothetical protein
MMFKITNYKNLVKSLFSKTDPTGNVLSWNAPTSVGDIQSFLGLARYYRRFIEGFSKISKPMTELLEKDKKFEWASACKASFQELKKRLTTAPILVMPDMEKSFSIIVMRLVKD